VARKIEVGRNIGILVHPAKQIPSEEIAIVIQVLWENKFVVDHAEEPPSASGSALNEKKADNLTIPYFPIKSNSVVPYLH